MEAFQQKNILYTVAYFNAMKYPLTVYELWRHCIAKFGKQESSYLEILREIERNPLKQKLSVNKGFVTLRGEDEKLVEKRISSQKNSLHSIRSLKHWVALFRRIPFVRGVFVTGTLSLKNARKQSDWDIMLVNSKNRIWIGRLFVGIALHLLGKRRHGSKVTRRFCLNHYITEGGLMLEEHSVYCSYFTTFSFPILGGALHKRFLQMNEHWVRNNYPNYHKDELNEADIFSNNNKTSNFQRVVETFLEKTKIAELLNNFSRKIMIAKIENNPLTHQKGADIRYNDCALVFLPSPHRVEMDSLTVNKLTKGT